MKKYLFLSVAAAAMMASCSNDQVDSPEMSPNNAIGFTAFTNNTSRGTGKENTVDISNLAPVVYGYLSATSGSLPGSVLVFDAVSLTKSGNNWVYYTTDAGKKYWVPNGNYTFLSYAQTPNGTGVTITTPTSNETVLNCVHFNNATAKANNDLVVATQNVATSNFTEGDNPQCPGDVQLTFNHTLARIQFAFTTDDVKDANNVVTEHGVAGDYSVKVENVKLSAPKNNGEQVFTAKCGTNRATLTDTGVNDKDRFGTWAAKTGTTLSPLVVDYTDWTYTDGYNNQTTNGQTGASETHYYVPFSEEATCTFDVVLLDKGVEVAKRTDCIAKLDASLLASKCWNQGCSYKLTLNFTMKNILNVECPINFNVSVSNWDEFGQEGSFTGTFTGGTVTTNGGGTTI